MGLSRRMFNGPNWSASSSADPGDCFFEGVLATRGRNSGCCRPYEPSTGRSKTNCGTHGEAGPGLPVRLLSSSIALKLSRMRVLILTWIYATRFRRSRSNADWPLNRLDELLPHRWVAAHSYYN